MSNTKQHWEQIYQTKALHEVSWYQPKPETSLAFFKQFNVAKNAKIIDVGGGDSLLVDFLLDEGFSDVTVLDISESALKRAKERMGARANLVKWIVADAAHFTPTEKYEVWHDRAAFHFLTETEAIENYINTAKLAIQKNGILIIGTFSEQGPKKCSGIDIRQYSETSMTELFEPYFEKVSCIFPEHQTPAGNIQNFIFCSFKQI
jgi:ubiquinone/menaquinone biosynthesis C-methylase UbiE